MGIKIDVSHQDPISAILFFNEYKIVLSFHLTAILLSSLLWYGQQFNNIILYEKYFLKIIVGSLKFHWKCYFKLISVVFFKKSCRECWLKFIRASCLKNLSKKGRLGIKTLQCWYLRVSWHSEGFWTKWTGNISINHIPSLTRLMILRFFFLLFVYIWNAKYFHNS